MLNAAREPKFTWTGPVVNPDYWKLASIALLVGILMSLPILRLADATPMQALVLSSAANGVGAWAATVFAYWDTHYFVFGSSFALILGLILLVPLVLIAMARIEESSRRIADIIGVIDEIARQTNLLALNAAVEAARAGEAGRGFAVVAAEVRSLAQRTSQAAKDIKELITNSSSQVQDGVDLVNTAGAALSEIVASIKAVADVVSDIAVASGEQATGLDQVNRALTQMDEVTQQNSELVEENAATAKTLDHQARTMDQQVSFFLIDDGEEVHPGKVARPGTAASAA